MARMISLDRDAFKALAGESRVQILKELNERQKTQSELATRLSLSAPTVNEHLLVLKKAGLVQETDDGHKWKYYSLTSKGKNLMNPSEVQITLVLSTLAVAFAGLLLMVLSQIAATASFAAQKAVPATSAPTLGAATEKATGGIANRAADQLACQATSAVQQLPLPELVLLLVSACFIGIMLGYLLKRRA